jgi:RNA polymerase sigma factor (sigma-70 family)
MSEGPWSGVVRHLRQVVAEADLADQELLTRFARGRDAAAFAALVRRHGSMVLGVCRRLLRDPHDADDAFQATFLALALHAGRVRRPGALAGWLYRVAYRVALAVRRGAGRVEQSAALDDVPGREDPVAEAAGRELAALVAAEVDRLPEPFRSAFLLCEAAGHSNAEAARLLGCAVGTVESRLTRARRRLRQALARHGLTPEGTAGVFGPASVTPELIRRTSESAALAETGRAAAGLVSAPVAALAEGAVRAMIPIKFKAMTAVLAVIVAGAGLGLVALAQPPAPTANFTPFTPALPAWSTWPAEIEEVFAKGELLRVSEKAVQLRPEHGLNTMTGHVDLDRNQPRVDYTQETTLMSVELPAGVAFTLDGKACQRTDLTAGMPAEVWVRKTEKGRAVIRVAAKYRDPVFVIAQPTDGWGVGLSVRVPGTKGPIFRLPMADRVRVATPEKLIPVEQLKPGMRVRLTMDAEQREIQAIDVLKDE